MRLGPQKQGITSSWYPTSELLSGLCLCFNFKFWFGHSCYLSTQQNIATLRQTSNWTCIDSTVNIICTKLFPKSLYFSNIESLWVMWRKVGRISKDPMVYSLTRSLASSRLDVLQMDRVLKSCSFPRTRKWLERSWLFCHWWRQTGPVTLSVTWADIISKVGQPLFGQKHGL